MLNLRAKAVLMSAIHRQKGCSNVHARCNFNIAGRHRRQGKSRNDVRQRKLDWSIQFASTNRIFDRDALQPGKASYFWISALVLATSSALISPTVSTLPSLTFHRRNGPVMSPY